MGQLFGNWISVTVTAYIYTFPHIPLYLLVPTSPLRIAVWCATMKIYFIGHLRKDFHPLPSVLGQADLLPISVSHLLNYQLPLQ